MAQVLCHGIIPVISSVQTTDIDITGMYFILGRMYSVKCTCVCGCVCVGACGCMWVCVYVCVYMCMWV